MTLVDRRKHKGGGSEKGGVTYIYNRLTYVQAAPPARVHAATLDYLADAHALLEARALIAS